MKRLLAALVALGALTWQLLPEPVVETEEVSAVETSLDAIAEEVDTSVSTAEPSALPDGCVEPNRHLVLHAVELPRVDGEIRLGYGFTPETASYPGPTIEMIEGDCLAVTLVNDISAETLAELRDHPRLGLLEPDANFPLGVSLHTHGVKYTAESDGTLHSGSWVAPGQSRTYVWYAEPRLVGLDGSVISHGTAGYWWYHDHVAGTGHGTGGVGSGLFGALIVRRAGDAPPDHTFVVALGDDATINLRHYPDTDDCDNASPQPSATCIVAAKGDVVEFVVIGIGNDFHTFHLHGHTWIANRTGTTGPMSGEAQIIDVIPLGPSASFGFQVVAGAAVGLGDWMIHCHVQRHSDLGMSTFLHVTEPGGSIPESQHEGHH